MFINNLKIAWRNFIKDRQFTILNLIGLSTGLACTLLIYLWVSDEMSFDKFHEKDRQLYQLMERRQFPDRVDISDESSGMLGETLAKETPEIEYATAVAPAAWFQKYTLSVGEKNLKAVGQYVGKDYFNIFSFKLIAGNKNQVLSDKNSIVISKDLARKLFNTTENIVGKSIQFEHKEVFSVSGIFERLPLQSSQQFDFLLSFEYFKQIQGWVRNWREFNSGPHNYVILKKGTDLHAFNQKIAGIIARESGDTYRTAFAMRFSDNYLYNTFEHGKRLGGRIEYVRMFTMIAAFILLIACINFMNLSTAKSGRRMREVGIKKVVGAGRKQPMFQFLGESFLVTFVAVTFSIFLVALFLPQFNQMTGKQLTLHISLELVLAVGCITLLTSLIAGSYPALYLSRFNPITALKGKLVSSVGELWVRKGLVIFQFSLSVMLIIGVMVVSRQLEYIQKKSLGYNKDHVIRFDSEGKMLNNQDNFTTALKQVPGIVNASGTSHKIVGPSGATSEIEWEGKNPHDIIFFEFTDAGYDFIETLGMTMASGRAFSKNFGNEPDKIILNEAAVNVMKLKDPVGKKVKVFNLNKEIIGVVKNFHFESLHETVKPFFIELVPKDGSNWYKIIARIKAGQEHETIERIKKFYADYNPGFIFEYEFLDEAFQKQYTAETHVGILSRYFAGLAIVISCLGLFGLVAFEAQRRQKEIGIRKVVGASVTNVAVMLSKDFLKLVLIAFLASLPLGWWIIHTWLLSFAYHIQIGPDTFLIAGASIILITFLTVGFQAIKASIANPVKSLRME